MFASIFNFRSHSGAGKENACVRSRYEEFVFRIFTHGRKKRPAGWQADRPASLARRNISRLVGTCPCHRYRQPAVVSATCPGLHTARHRSHLSRSDEEKGRGGRSPNTWRHCGCSPRSKYSEGMLVGCVRCFVPKANEFRAVHIARIFPQGRRVRSPSFSFACVLFSWTQHISTMARIFLVTSSLCVYWLETTLLSRVALTVCFPCPLFYVEACSSFSDEGANLWFGYSCMYTSPMATKEPIRSSPLGGVLSRARGRGHPDNARL